MSSRWMVAEPEAFVQHPSAWQGRLVCATLSAVHRHIGASFILEFESRSPNGLRGCVPTGPQPVPHRPRVPREAKFAS
jgi:hypothetical protein